VLYEPLEPDPVEFEGEDPLEAPVPALDELVEPVELLEPVDEAALETINHKYIATTIEITYSGLLSV
jgi:hypothetical protein